MLIYLEVIDAQRTGTNSSPCMRPAGSDVLRGHQILQNEQDAEDADHDAFLSVAEHIKIFSSGASQNKAFLVLWLRTKLSACTARKPIARKKFSGRRPQASRPALRTGGQADPVHFEAARPVPGISPFEIRAGLLHQGGG